METVCNQRSREQIQKTCQSVKVGQEEENLLITEANLPSPNKKEFENQEPENEPEVKSENKLEIKSEAEPKVEPEAATEIVPQDKATSDIVRARILVIRQTFCTIFLCINFRISWLGRDHLFILEESRLRNTALD